MKLLLTIILSLTVGLATSCKATKSYVEVERWNNYGLLCGQKPGSPCIVVYTWYNGRILHSEYLPMNTPDSTIKADSLKGVEMSKNQ